ncbi:MAG TPA: DUF6491 family protein [Rhizomicrobium sp.]|nr:DUF6491 family protein [Rhizomicrobium sp.]
MRKLFLILVGTAMLAATPALADSCIRHDDIYNWNNLDDRTLILENYRHQKFMVKLVGTCQDFTFHQRLIIKSPGALRISCVQRGDIVITPNNGISGRCAITSITPYVAPAKGDKANMSAPHSGY